MTATRLPFLGAFMMLAACSGGSEPQPISEPQPTEDGDDEIKTAQKCGGIAGRACPSGLVCEKPSGIKDGMGVCRKPKDWIACGLNRCNAKTEFCATAAGERYCERL